MLSRPASVGRYIDTRAISNSVEHVVDDRLDDLAHRPRPVEAAIDPVERLEGVDPGPAASGEPPGAALGFGRDANHDVHPGRGQHDHGRADDELVLDDVRHAREAELRGVATDRGAEEHGQCHGKARRDRGEREGEQLQWGGGRWGQRHDVDRPGHHHRQQDHRRAEHDPGVRQGHHARRGGRPARAPVATARGSRGRARGRSRRRSGRAPCRRARARPSRRASPTPSAAPRRRDLAATASRRRAPRGGPPGGPERSARRSQGPAGRWPLGPPKSSYPTPYGRAGRPDST